MSSLICMITNLYNYQQELTTNNTYSPHLSDPPVIVPNTLSSNTAIIIIANAITGFLLSLTLHQEKTM